MAESTDEPKVGNGYWIVKSLVAALWLVVVTTFLFVGNTVKANDEKATTEHTAIRKEIGVEKEKIEAKVEKVRENIEKNIDKIQTTQTTLLVQNERMLTILEQLKEN